MRELGCGPGCGNHDEAGFRYEGVQKYQIFLCGTRIKCMTAELSPGSFALGRVG